MGEEEIKKLADTLLKSGLATNQTEAMEKARSSFGAEQILKKLQKKEPLFRETKTVSELHNEAKAEQEAAAKEMPKPVAPSQSEDESVKKEAPLAKPHEKPSKDDIQIDNIIDLDEEKEAEEEKEEE